jgi:hypothetical protein
MLDRALSDDVAEAVEVDDDVVVAVANDLIATLGWTQEQAENVARRTAVALARQDVSDHLAFAVAEDVQQWLQDTFLDTTWPACPEHRQHPLWLSEDDPPMWTCPASGRVYCRLGDLSTVVSIAAADAERNRERLGAEHAATETTMKLFKGLLDHRRRRS